MGLKVRLPFMALFMLSIISCTEGTIIPFPYLVQAAIHTTCSTEINYMDVNDNVYVYDVFATFGLESIQAGGHSTVLETTDLGVNIFGPENRGVYTVTDGTDIELGEAFVFYTDEDGVEWISTANNTGEVNLTSYIFNTSYPDEPAEVQILFDNVQVTNGTDTLCINEFRLQWKNKF